jgi:hypothetical protein
VTVTVEPVQRDPLNDLLVRLHDEVAERMSATRSTPSFTVASRITEWGRTTRATRSGDVQVGWRDAGALRELALGHGPIDPSSKLYQRAVVAIDNVTTAQASLIANPTRSSQNHLRPRLFLREAAKRLGASAAVGAASTASAAAGELPSTGNPVFDAPIEIGSWIGKVPQEALNLSSPVQAGLIVGGAFAVGAVSDAWINARQNDGLGGGVDRAFAQSDRAGTYARLGVADRLPDAEHRVLPTAVEPATVMARGLGRELSEQTGVDHATALTTLAKAAPADRAGVVVDLLTEASGVESLPRATRERAIDKVYDAMNGQGSPQPGHRILDDAYEVISPGNAAETPLPNADTLQTVADPGQSRTIQVALGDYPRPGSGPAEQAEPAGSGAQPTEGGRANNSQAAAPTRDTPNERQ